MKLSELAATKWSGNDVKIAVAVALAESRGKLDATHHNSNGTDDDGPWQVNSIHGYDRNKLRSDPNYTVNAAYEVWKSSGWGAWVTYKTGMYLAFMGQDAELTADDKSFLDKVKDGVGDGVSDVIGTVVPGAGALTGDGLGGAVGGLLGIPNPLNLSVPGLDDFANTIGALRNPSTWARIGKGALGGGLIILGVGSLVFIVANRAASSPVVKAASSAIPL